jgi:ribokinase
VPRVCVVGSANVDFTVALERLPSPGETVSGGTLLRNLGGKGANQAVTARRLGAQVRLLGAVGDDASGAEIRARLGAEGIDVEGLVTMTGTATGTALICVDAAGRNQIAVAPGANHAATVAALAPHADAIRWAQVVVCQLELPLSVVAWALGEARAAGAATILNPAPMRALEPALLALADYLTPNEGEAARLAGAAVTDLASARVAGERIREGGAGTVILTLGGQGALVCGVEGAVHFPAFPVTVVDTTAAGDAFNGALAVGLAAGGTLEQALPLANATAALTCTARGAQDALPRRADVERFLAALRA